MAFAVEGDGVGFATESYAASALYTTLASLSGALSRIRRAKAFEGYVVRKDLVRKFKGQYPVPTYVAEFLFGALLRFGG